MRSTKLGDVQRRCIRFWPTLAVAGLCACGPGTDAAADSEGAVGGVVAADSISLDDVRAMIDAVGAEQLFDRVAEPSPVLTDFFGIQPIGPVRTSQVIEDLVPQYASVVSREGDALVLGFADGPRVTFPSGTRLVVASNRVDVRYARVEIRDPAAYPAEPAAFRAVLEVAGLSERYLLPNRYFAAEQVVSARMREAASMEAAPVAEDTTGFGAAPFAAILVGETHGGTEMYDRAMELLESPAIDWIGIEMLGENLQPALDRFLDAAGDPAGYPSGDTARSSLLDYYATNWNTRGHEVTAEPAGNPYFRLIERARSLGKPVYALDTDPLYILFRFGEFPLGATVRDFVWASNIPLIGRGVVYGGSSHFQSTRRPNMLTFLVERFPDIALFEIGAGN